MVIDSKVLICRNDNSLASKLDGEVIMLDPDKGTYYNLNRVGSFIWDFLEKPASLDDICRKVRARFEVSEEVCRTDIIQYIKQMNDYGLIKVSK
jgi:hypothetical protein